MALTYTKTLMSSGAIITGADGRTTVTERYRLEATDAGVRQKLYPRQLAELQDNTILPKRLYPYATWLNGGDAWSMSTLVKTMRLREAFAAEVPESNGILDVQLTWGTRYTVDKDAAIGIWLPWTGNYTVDVSRIPVWRRLDDCDAPSPTSAPGTSDIHGTKIDVMGQPVDGLAYGGSFVVRGIVDGIAVDKAQWFDDANALVGLLNSTTLFGFAAYSLLLDSPSIEDLEDEYYTVTCPFRASGTYHCEQVAILDPDGKPTVTAGHSNYVYWRRASNEAANFSSYWSAAEQHRIRHGMKVYP